MPHFRTLSAIAIAAAFLAGPAAAAPAWFTRDAVAAHYAALVAEPAELRTLAEGLYGPVPDPIWAVMERRTVAAMAQPGYADLFYDLIQEDIPDAATPADLFRLGEIAINKASNAGALRLSQAEQEQFLQLSADLLRWTETNAPASCNALMSEDTEAIEATRMEYAFLDAADPAYVDHYVGTAYEAIAAEIAGGPAAPKIDLDPAAAMAAATAYQAAYDALVATRQAHVTSGGDEPGLACSLGRVSIDAIFALPEAQRGLMILLSLLASNEAQ